MSKFELENVLDEAALAYFAYLFAHFHLRQQAQLTELGCDFLFNFKIRILIFANLHRVVIFVYSTAVRHELIDNSTGGKRARSILRNACLSKWQRKRVRDLIPCPSSD